MPSKLIVTGHPGLEIPPWRRPDRTTRLGIKGIIKAVELIDAKTGFVKRRLTEFPNLIVNAGLNGIGNGATISSLIDFVGVGTDNTTPAVGDTSLGSQVGARYNANGGFPDVVAAGASYAYWSVTRTREIPANDGNGNLTELGFFSLSTGGVMWNRALFLSGGVPTTLTKTVNEILRIVYEWRVYLVLTPTDDVITINTVSTTCSSRALRGNDDDAWGTQGIATRLGSWQTDYRRCSAFETNTFPAIDGGGFTGLGQQCSSISTVTYVSGNFYVDQDIIFEPGTGNFTTGIGAIALPRIGDFSGSASPLGTIFTPKVSKSNLQRFTFRARVSFTRV